MPYLRSWCGDDAHALQAVWRRLLENLLPGRGGDAHLQVHAGRGRGGRRPWNAQARHVPGAAARRRRARRRGCGCLRRLAGVRLHRSDPAPCTHRWLESGSGAALERSCGRTGPRGPPRAATTRGRRVSDACAVALPISDRTVWPRWRRRRTARRGLSFPRGRDASLPKHFRPAPVPVQTFPARTAPEAEAQMSEPLLLWSCVSGAREPLDLLSPRKCAGDSGARAFSHAQSREGFEDGILSLHVAPFWWPGCAVDRASEVLQPTEADLA